MSNTNDTVALNFLQQTGRAVYGNTCHYSGTNFYSYNTLYALLDTDKNVLLISDSNMSSTTSKHRNALVSNAIKVTDTKILQVPMQYNNPTTPTLDTLKTRFEARMDNLVLGTNLALADNRREFMISMANYKLFCEYANLTPNKKYTDIEDKIQDTEYIKELQHNRRKHLRNKQENYDTVIREHFNGVY